MGSLQKTTAFFFRNYCAVRFISTSLPSSNSKKGRQMKIDRQQDYVTNYRKEKERRDRAERELKVWLALGKDMPQDISREDYDRVLSFRSSTDRLSYLFKLRKLEQRDEYDDRKREKRKQEAALGLPIPARPSPENLWHSQKCMAQFYGSRVLSAARCNDGPRVVFDTSVSGLCNGEEVQQLTRQLVHGFHDNAAHIHPFALYLTGVNKKTLFWNQLEKLISVDKNYRFLETEQDYLELFPREKLVYLSPESKETLEEFDADRVYIIGAMIDIETRFSSYKKARSEGLATARLPMNLNRLPRQCSYSTRLGLHEVLGILLDMHLSSSIESAVYQNLDEHRMARRKVRFKLNEFKRGEMEQLIPMGKALSKVLYE